MRALLIRINKNWGKYLDFFVYDSILITAVIKALLEKLLKLLFKICKILIIKIKLKDIICIDNFLENRKDSNDS